MILLFCLNPVGLGSSNIITALQRKHPRVLKSPDGLYPSLISIIVPHPSKLPRLCRRHKREPISGGCPIKVCPGSPVEGFRVPAVFLTDLVPDVAFVFGPVGHLELELDAAPFAFGVPVELVGDL